MALNQQDARAMKAHPESRTHGDAMPREKKEGSRRSTSETTTLEVSKALKRILRMIAADRDVPMRVVVEEAINAYIAEIEKGKKGKK